MDFDIQGAQQSGYSPSEIANYLASQNRSFDLDGARKAGYSDEEITQHLAGNEPSRSFDENVNSDYAKRQDETNNIGSDYQSGKLNLAGALAGTASTGLGLVKDVADDAVKGAWNALPNAVTSPVEAGASSLKDMAISTLPGTLLSGIAPVVKREYSEFASDHPNIAAALNLGGNIAAVAPVAKSATTLAERSAKMLGAMGEESGASMSAALGGVPSGIDRLMPKVSTADEMSKTSDALKATKTIGYDNAKAQGAVLTPAASDHVAITVPQEVESKLGIRLDPNDQTYSQTRSALNNLQGKSAMGLTTNDLEQTRQRLNDILNGSSSGGDRAAAVVAKRSIDNIYQQIEQNPQMLVNGNPAAIQAFRDARAANGVYQRYSTISNIISDARSNPGKIQSAFQKLVSSRNENDFNLFAPDEQAMITKIAYPNGIDTKLEGNGIGSKILHASGVVGSTIAGSVAGGEMGHPLIGAAFGAGKGVISGLNDTLKSAKILKSADDLQKMVAAKAKPITPYGNPRSTQFQAALNAYRARNP